MKKLIATTTALGMLAFAGSAMASLMLDTGTKLLMVDGDGDTNLSVLLESDDYDDGFDLKYSVNGGSWVDVSDSGYETFTGGDVVDLALVDSSTNYYYILSEDINDDSFDVLMEFAGEIASTEAEQPAMETSYYHTVTITWNIGTSGFYTFSDSTALIFKDGDPTTVDNNDGVAPVPEPATILLLGTGLAGLAGLNRRKAKQK